MRLKLSPLSRALAAAALIAAVLVPASAAGSTTASVKMDVVPLPQSALGPAAKALELSQHSGAVSNDAAGALTLDWSGPWLTKMGRVSGYMLDYGHPASGGSGITNVRTSIERYRMPSDARFIFNSVKTEDARLGRHLSHGVLTVKSTRVKVPALGKARFAYLTTYRAANIAPLATLDERVLEGKYLLQAQVSAGTAAAAKALAPKLAKKLDARFKLALKGRLHATPVQLPPTQTPGPPIGGPDLSAFALTSNDLGGNATIDWAGYGSWPFPRDFLSEYEVYSYPLYQQIEWYATANEAAFRTDRSQAHALNREMYPFNALDLSSVGHGVQAVATAYPSGGYGVEIMLNVGQLAEVLWITSERPIQASDVLPVVRAAATRIDAVYTP